MRLANGRTLWVGIGLSQGSVLPSLLLPLGLVLLSLATVDSIGSGDLLHAQPRLPSLGTLSSWRLGNDTRGSGS